MKPINLFKPQQNDFKQMLSISGKQVYLNSQKILALVTNVDTHQFDDKRLSTDRMFSRGDIVHYDNDYYMVITQVAHRYESFNGQMRRLENHIYFNMSFLSESPEKYIMKIPVIPQKTGEFNLKTNNTWGIIDVVQRISLFVPQNEYTSRIIELENQPKGIIIFGRRPYNIIGVTNNDKGMYAINLELTTLEKNEYDKENGIYMPPLNWKNYENLSIYELSEDKQEPIPQVQTNIGTIKTIVDDSTWSTELKVTWDKDKSSPLYSEYLTGYKVGLYYGSVLGLEKTVSSPDTLEVIFDPFKDYKDSYTIKVQAIYSKEGTITYMLPQVETFETNIKPEQGTVTINYVDDKGVSIKPIVKLTGNVGSQYQTEQSNISDYEFLTVDGATSGVFTKEPITVTYKYKKVEQVQGTVTVSYTATDGTKLKDDVIIKQVVGTSYSTIKDSFEGYTFKQVVGNETGIITVEPQTVKYTYDKIPVTGTVTVYYKDENGTALSEPITMTGNVGTSYTTVKKTINSYDFVSVTGSETGKYINGTINVIYNYKKQVVAEWKMIPPVFENLQVMYESPTLQTSKLSLKGTNDIAQNPVFHNSIFRYIIELYGIKKNGSERYITNVYTSGPLNETTALSTSTFTMIDEEVSLKIRIRTQYFINGEYNISDYSSAFVLTKGVWKTLFAPQVAPQVAPQGKVIVNYIDDDTKEVIETVTLTGVVGSNYTTTKKDYSSQDYDFNRVVGSTTGVFTKEDITVNYYYKSNGGW